MKINDSVNNITIITIKKSNIIKLSPYICVFHSYKYKHLIINYRLYAKKIFSRNINCSI